MFLFFFVFVLNTTDIFGSNSPSYYRRRHQHFDKEGWQTENKWVRMPRVSYIDAREYEIGEQIPHTWLSSNGNIFHSNFNTQLVRPVTLQSHGADVITSTRGVKSNNTDHKAQGFAYLIFSWLMSYNIINIVVTIDIITVVDIMILLVMTIVKLFSGTQCSAKKNYHSGKIFKDWTLVFKENARPDWALGENPLWAENRQTQLTNAVKPWIEPRVHWCKASATSMVSTLLCIAPRAFWNFFFFALFLSQQREIT